MASNDISLPPAVPWAQSAGAAQLGCRQSQNRRRVAALSAEHPEVARAINDPQSPFTVTHALKLAERMAQAAAAAAPQSVDTALWVQRVEQEGLSVRQFCWHLARAFAVSGRPPRAGGGDALVQCAAGVVHFRAGRLVIATLPADQRARLVGSLQQVLRVLDAAGRRVGAFRS